MKTTWFIFSIVLALIFMSAAMTSQSQIFGHIVSFSLAIFMLVNAVLLIKTLLEEFDRSIKILLTVEEEYANYHKKYGVK